VHFYSDHAELPPKYEQALQEVRQQQSTKQCLQRNRRPTKSGVQLLKFRRQSSPRTQSVGSAATDDPLEPAPRSLTQPNGASLLTSQPRIGRPHISSRTVDFTQCPDQWVDFLRILLGEGQFADIVIWQLPGPVPDSGHKFKYRSAFVVDQVWRASLRQ
jgi:hypothetical protein